MQIWQTLIRLPNLDSLIRVCSAAQSYKKYPLVKQNNKKFLVQIRVLCRTDGSLCFQIFRIYKNRYAIAATVVTLTAHKSLA